MTKPADALRLTLLRRSRYFPYLLLAVIVLLHRALLFAYLYPDYLNFIRLNEGYLTWQYLPPPLLKDNLLTALWYLQQNPPLTQIFIGLALKLAGSMQALSLLLIGVQALISLLTTLLLYRLLTGCGVRGVLALLLAAVFALSADLVFLEYRTFGQLLYQTLCMPLLLTLVLLLQRFLQQKKTSHLFWIGVLVATLALTRASAGYFFLPVLLYLLCLRVGARGILVFLLPILLLQGGWAAKNTVVYGYVSLPATSWTGLNMMRVINGAGHLREVKQLVAAEPERYPAWFVSLVKGAGYRSFFTGHYAPYIPEDIKRIDAAIAEKLPGNPPTNTVSLYYISQYYKQAAVQYAFAHPLDYAAGIWNAYRLFWYPIRDYTNRFSSLLSVESEAVEVWRAEGLWGFVRGSYELDNNYILLKNRRPQRFGEGPVCPQNCRPAGLLVLPYAAMVVYALNILALHVLGPLLAALLLCSKKTNVVDRRLFFLLYLIYGYFAAVSSVGEYGENNRFRLDVEPVIWLLTAYILLGCSRLRATQAGAVRAPESS